MRIALATSSFAPYIGGVEEHVRNVAHALQRRGHDVVVWTVEREGGHGVREVEGIPVWDLPAPLPGRSPKGLAGFAARAPRAAALWRQALRAHRPDLIHVHCFGPNGSYVRRLARAAGVPWILTGHGETLADDENVFVSSRFAAHSLRRGLAEASAVTACSRTALDDLIARFGLADGSGTVIVNGIELDEELGVLPEGIGGRYIAAIGRVQRLKGFDLLLEAFARAQLPADISLVIGGAGPELAPLAARAAALGIADRVRLPGWLDRPTVGAVRRDALIGVVPSRTEPFGIAALEIWRAASTLVATTHGGPPEFVRDGEDGVLVDPLDIDALAAVLAGLVADPDRARRLADAGARRVTAFTWGHVTDRYEELYRQIVTAPATPTAARATLKEA
ncbi:glycosyltransferase family 4 protein [Gryllotalpicola reticulitermitis]|uniref:Glycosyltransferase family 4 protein n=1 Tax=Gryllotalpicola reticulitermitis TaxID=1184153 RepID=A0ABV8Q940_9MICO